MENDDFAFIVRKKLFILVRNVFVYIATNVVGLIIYILFLFIANYIIPHSKSVFSKYVDQLWGCLLILLIMITIYYSAIKFIKKESLLIDAISVFAIPLLVLIDLFENKGFKKTIYLALNYDTIKEFWDISIQSDFFHKISWIIIPLISVFVFINVRFRQRKLTKIISIIIGVTIAFMPLILMLLN